MKKYRNEIISLCDDFINGEKELEEVVFQLKTYQRFSRLQNEEYLKEKVNLKLYEAVEDVIPYIEKITPFIYQGIVSLIHKSDYTQKELDQLQEKNIEWHGIKFCTEDGDVGFELYTDSLVMEYASSKFKLEKDDIIHISSFDYGGFYNTDISDLDLDRIEISKDILEEAIFLYIEEFDPSYKIRNYIQEYFMEVPESEFINGMEKIIKEVKERI